MRQAKNSIMDTFDSNGKQTNSLAEMKERAVSYFANRFLAPDKQSPIHNLNITFDERQSDIENAKLRAFPSGEEIWNALSSMSKCKALGMDKLTSEVINRHWNLMKDDITVAILYFFNTERMLRSLNLAILILIPKIQLPEQLEDYRPISCLGVIYKILSKRLMIVLPGIISVNQTTLSRGTGLVMPSGWLKNSPRLTTARAPRGGSASL